MIERVLMEYIANAVWQIPLLAGGAWILLWMARPRPQVQHGVWLAVLGLAALLPVHGMSAASGVPVVRAQSVAVGAQGFQGSSGARGSTVAWGERAVPLETEGLLGTEGLRLEWAPRLHSVHLAAAAVYWIVALYVSAMLLGMFLGRWLDRMFHSGIFWTAPLLLLGLALGCWSAWKWVNSA